MATFGSEAAGAAAAARGAALGARAAPLAVRALGVVGAVVSTGVAVHGWTTSKMLQDLVRGKRAELATSMLDTQRWLAAMSELECSICLGNIGLTEQVSCCRDSWHYTHRRCLQNWASECRAAGRESTCPLCCGPLDNRTGPLEGMI